MAVEAASTTTANRSGQGQSFENHARIVPLYHFLTLGIFQAYFLWTLYRLIKAPSVDTSMAVLLAFALILLSLYARRFAVTVQDRVIRLEMQLRMRALLPPDLQHRIDELSTRQLVALRFASDAELPDLARAVITEKIADQKTIKKMIRDWRPDHLRA
jgi:hypothetical protein